MPKQNPSLNPYLSGALFQGRGMTMSLPNQFLRILFLLLTLNHLLPTSTHPHLYTTQNPSGWYDLPCHPFPGGICAEAKLQEHAEGAC